MNTHLDMSVGPTRKLSVSRSGPSMCVFFCCLCACLCVCRYLPRLSGTLIRAVISSQTTATTASSMAYPTTTQQITAHPELPITSHVTLTHSLTPPQHQSPHQPGPPTTSSVKQRTHLQKLSSSPHLQSSTSLPGCRTPPWISPPPLHPIQRRQRRPRQNRAPPKPLERRP